VDDVTPREDLKVGQQGREAADLELIGEPQKERQQQQGQQEEKLQEELQEQEQQKVHQDEEEQEKVHQDEEEQEEDMQETREQEEGQEEDLQGCAVATGGGRTLRHVSEGGVKLLQFCPVNGCAPELEDIRLLLVWYFCYCTKSSTSLHRLSWGFGVCTQLKTGLVQEVLIGSQQPC
jgi:hypothetical protein